MQRYFKEAAKWGRYILERLKTNGCGHRWDQAGQIAIYKQTLPTVLTEWPANHALLWSTSRTSVPPVPFPGSVSLADVSTVLGRPPKSLQGGRRRSQEALDRGGLAECSSVRESDKVLASDKGARWGRTVIPNYLEQKNFFFMISLTFN